MLLVLFFVGPVLSGCIGGNDPAEPSSLPAASELNPWQAGLATHLPTPDVAQTASQEERRRDVVDPGSPRFAAFDAVVEAFLDAYDVPAASVAVMHDGKLLYENGYGTVDEAGSTPADPQTMMRLASVTKPMTSAVTWMLVEEGLVAWDDPVFCVPPEVRDDCLLPIAPHPDRPVVDDRIADITVRHLVDHTSGLPFYEACNDPIWSEASIRVAESLGVATPLPRWRMAQWAMGAELTAAPGGAYAYCNVGYVTLSLVAESVTGATMEAVYDAYLFRPLEIDGDIEFGYALPEDRNPSEPMYACDVTDGRERTASVFDPEDDVCWADGGFSVRGLSGAGGLIATPAAVAAVFDRYDFSGEPLYQARYLVGVMGSLPGTAALANTWMDDVHGKINIAVMFNTRIGATPLAQGTPEVHPAQAQTCAIEYGLIRPFQCLTVDLAREYAAAQDAVPGG